MNSAPVTARPFAHGLVIGKFYPLHAGHSGLIRHALAHCGTVTVQVLGSSVESIPLAVRTDWVRIEHPTARVVCAIDDAPVDFDDPAAWDAHMLPIRALLVDAPAGPVDAVFTSDAYGEELARRLDAQWVRVDPDRLTMPVSGRAVRDDVAGYWWALAPAVRAWLARRVVVLGAESTGTSTLAHALGDTLAVPVVPEYGREYSAVRPGGPFGPWRSEEFDLIADRHIALEQRALIRTPAPIVVCDTDVLATAVWHERYLGVGSPHLVARAAEHRPALYVLTGDEIPFVQDGTRDGRQIRHGMHRRFREVLAEQPTPWLEVTGTIDQRLRTALAAIAEHLRPHRFAPPLEMRPMPPPDSTESRTPREWTGDQYG